MGGRPGAGALREHRSAGAGQPVQAALSLDLVDKAVLSLLPRPINAILEAFYGRRMLGVNTSADLAISINKANERLQEDLERQTQVVAQTKALPAMGGGPGAAGAGAETNLCKQSFGRSIQRFII